VNTKTVYSSFFLAIPRYCGMYMGTLKVNPNMPRLLMYIDQGVLMNREPVDKIAIQGFKPEKLWIHYSKHKDEFADIYDIENYNTRAIKLISSKLSKNILGFTDDDGRIFRYNIKKNEFAVCWPDGYIATFFRPTDGRKFYYRQVELYGA
jgi:hypothetical protein